MNTIEKIKNAFKIISNDLPVSADKFMEMLYDLTNCEIEYDLFPKVEKIERVYENRDLREYVARDRVYCVENGVEREYVIEAKVIDTFDTYKTVAIIHEYKIQRIELKR
jgi:hypothetical protein